MKPLSHATGDKPRRKTQVALGESLSAKQTHKAKMQSNLIESASGCSVANICSGRYAQTASFRNILLAAEVGRNTAGKTNHR
jgi:hypothetical protein